LGVNVQAAQTASDTTEEEENEKLSTPKDPPSKCSNKNKLTQKHVYVAGMIDLALTKYWEQQRLLTIYRRDADLDLQLLDDIGHEIRDLHPTVGALEQREKVLHQNPMLVRRTKWSSHGASLIGNVVRRLRRHVCHVLRVPTVTKSLSLMYLPAAYSRILASLQDRRN
jgi:hypothetical protein